MDDLLVAAFFVLVCMLSSCRVHAPGSQRPLCRHRREVLSADSAHKARLRLSKFLCLRCSRQIGRSPSKLTLIATLHMNA